MRIARIEIPKITLNVSKYIVFFTIFNMLLYHFPLYSFAFSNLDFSISGILTFFILLIALFIAISFVLFLFALISPLILKLFCCFSLIGNAIALYFVLTYKVILDKTMMGNVFNTNLTEASSYYHPKLILFIIFLGILPSLFIITIQIKKVRRLRLIFQSTIVFLFVAFLAYINSNTWLWFDEHSKQIGGMIMPAAYIVNPIRYEMKRLEGAKEQILLPSATFDNGDQIIVVLVIGESARAENFSLLGYPRQTNPELDKLDVTAIEATAASTYTTASINSMLSFKGATSDSYEPLPSYLQRHGIDVIWRTNNWGEPKINVETFQREKELRASCKGEGCAFDEVLLTNLSERISSSKKEKIFIVLHTSGSHGPLYNNKTPNKYKIFKPICKTVDLGACTSQEVINTYDNTIIYTDYFLSKVIKLLKKHSQIPSLMIYASDHGESLGEYGLYLHGTPFMLAPDVQKKVPFIFWASNGYLRSKGVKSLQLKQQQEYSHKNIFHTILGAFNVESSVYNQKLDAVYISKDVEL